MDETATLPPTSQQALAHQYMKWALEKLNREQLRNPSQKNSQAIIRLNEAILWTESDLKIKEQFTTGVYVAVEKDTDPIGSVIYGDGVGNPTGLYDMERIDPRVEIRPLPVDLIKEKEGVSE